MNLLFRLKRYIRTPPTKTHMPMINRVAEGYSNNIYTIPGEQMYESEFGTTHIINQSHKDWHESVTISKTNITYITKIYRSIDEYNNPISDDFDLPADLYTKSITENEIHHGISYRTGRSWQIDQEYDENKELISCERQWKNKHSTNPKDNRRIIQHFAGKFTQYCYGHHKNMIIITYFESGEINVQLFYNDGTISIKFIHNDNIINIVHIITSRNNILRYYVRA